LFSASSAAAVPSASSTGGAQGIWVAPTASDVAITGKTTRLRLRVPYMVNATAPGITLTWGLYVVSALAGGVGSITVTLGAVVTGSTAAAVTPSASGPGSTTGSSFDMSLITPGSAYVIGVVGSGTQAANSVVASQPILEMRHT
jgi:hypothetical protein